MTELKLCLASRSPQRRAILQQLRIGFWIVDPEVEEREDGLPDEVAVQNARRKALAVAARYGQGWFLGVDTVVCLEQRIYGKPASESAARDTLAALSGRWHEVVGGICLVQDGNARTTLARTRVRFREVTEGLIDWYVSTGEWRERAGGYAIQGAGAALVAGIEGDYLNVVGLSVAALLDLEPGLLG